MTKIEDITEHRSQTTQFIIFECLEETKARSVVTVGYRLATRQLLDMARKLATN